MDPLVARPHRAVSGIAEIVASTDNDPRVVGQHPCAFPGSSPREPELEHARQSLVVAKEERVRELVSALLVSLERELEVLQASDGDQVISMALQRKPDRVLLNIIMPKTTGWAVLEVLRARPETHDTNVAMVSALTQLSVPRKASKMGLMAYLAKPFTRAADGRSGQGVGLACLARRRYARLHGIGNRSPIFTSYPTVLPGGLVASRIYSVHRPCIVPW